MVQEKLNKPDILAALQSTLQEGIEAGVPGLSAGIWSKQGTLWQSTAGLIDFETQKPVEITNLFGIGSITKMFVSVVILQLVDEKKLRLSESLGNILSPDVLRGIENAPQATVAGLLSHTAGVDSWEEDPVWIINGRGKLLDPGKIWGKAETLDYVRRPNPSGPKPGQWSYSNTNFTLLGLVIEKITQQLAEDEIRRRILKPLNMNQIYLEGFEEPRGEPSPRRYHWATDTFRKIAGICPSFSQVRDNLIDTTGSNLSVEWTAGGMVSPPSDLLSFAIALRDGKLLSSSSLEVMKDWRPAGEGVEMGHGLFRFESPVEAGRWLGHPGSVLGFTGALWWKEEGDCAVCVLANVGTMHAGDVPSSASDVVLKTRFLRLASELAACE